MNTMWITYSSTASVDSGVDSDSSVSSDASSSGNDPSGTVAGIPSCKFSSTIVFLLVIDYRRPLIYYHSICSSSSRSSDCSTSFPNILSGSMSTVWSGFTM